MAPQRQPLNDEQRRLLKITVQDAPGQREQPGLGLGNDRGAGPGNAGTPALRRLGVSR